MKFVSISLAVLALRSGVLASPTHQDPTTHHVEHVNDNPSRTVKALEWIGPIAPAGEVYAYYGSIKDVGMHMIQVTRDAQVRRVGTHERRSKGRVVCNRVDQPLGHYGETWAAYKLAAVMGSLATTNSSAVVAIEGGHGRCVDLTDCKEAERARIQLCNDNPKPISVKIQTIAEYAYKIIYECAKTDGSGLVWGQQFDTKDFNVIVSACPVADGRPQ